LAAVWKAAEPNEAAQAAQIQVLHVLVSKRVMTAAWRAEMTKQMIGLTG
jgi:hypothetical protein